MTFLYLQGIDDVRQDDVFVDIMWLQKPTLSENLNQCFGIKRKVLSF